MLPVGPVLPVEPVLPVGPLLPISPVLPVGPVLPVEPVLPVGPLLPISPVLPVGPVLPVEPVEPVLPVGPVETFTKRVVCKCEIVLERNLRLNEFGLVLNTPYILIPTIYDKSGIIVSGTYTKESY